MESIKFWVQEKKKWLITAAVLIIAAVAFGAFFFSYYKVKNVTVMGSNHYKEAEIRKMVLKGPFSDNSVLAPILYSKDGIEDIPFIKGYSVTAQSRDTICITLKEELPVGCVPYLDQYIYFNKEGIFAESSYERDPAIPFFDGIELNTVVRGEALPLAGDSVLNTAVALNTIFKKNQHRPDDIQFDGNNITLIYGTITVCLGKDQFLEDKMARMLAILPKLEDEEGILHMEGINEHVKVVTFERVMGEVTSANWKGGYDEYGDFTGDGEYDEKGRHVGPRPMSEYDYAMEAWAGGYDDDGDFTGWGSRDKYGNLLGAFPSREEFDSWTDWHGGYDENGSYTITGPYDRNGGYAGPNPYREEVVDEKKTSSSDDSYSEDGYSEESYNEDYYGENSYGDGSGGFVDPHDEAYYDSLYDFDSY
ncbi:MAG: cell division septal protein [Clostridiales bacterium]|nr:cell division septal protein [Candidatus Blautia equi]